MLLSSLVYSLYVVYNLYYLHLILLVHCIEYIARMSDLLGLIDILDDDGALHLNELSTGSVSGAIGVASPVIPSSWVPFSGVFVVCLLIFYFMF